MRIEILGVPFNGLGTFPDIENPLRQANLMSLLEASGHIVTDLGDLSGFQCQDIRDDETGINDFGMWLNLSQELSQMLGGMLDRQAFPLLLGGDCRMLVGLLFPKERLKQVSSFLTVMRIFIHLRHHPAAIPLIWNWQS